MRPTRDRVEFALARYPLPGEVRFENASSGSILAAEVRALREELVSALRSVTRLQNAKDECESTIARVEAFLADADALARGARADDEPTMAGTFNGFADGLRAALRGPK